MRQFPCALVENVQALLTVQKGKVWRVLRAVFEGIGYAVQVAVDCPANWRRLPFAASCAVVVAVVGADAELLVGCACLCKSAARQDSDPAPTGTAQVNPSSRRARRETGPLASERPGGPPS